MVTDYLHHWPSHQKKLYTELCELVKKHQSPDLSTIVERSKFNIRIQPGESVSAFVGDLRKLMEHCKYVTFLSEMIRDRPVCRVNDARIQQILFAEGDTLEKAIEVAVLM